MNNTLDKTQTQYERKVARQKQLDMMEAAAAGQSYSGENSSDTGSVASKNSRSTDSIAPEGAIESARRFLWDEDEEEYGRQNAAAGAAPTHNIASTYEHYAGADQQTNLMGGNLSTGPGENGSGGFGSRLANSIMGSFFRPRESDTANNVNLAPRRASANNTFMGDAQPREADEYIEKKRRGGFITLIGECCMAMLHTFLGALAILCEYLTACLASINPKLCVMMMVALTGVGLFIFAIVAIVHRSKSGGVSDTSGAITYSGGLPQIVDQVRYDGIRTTITGSAFTSEKTLDTPGTAQNYALRWLTDEDPGKLQADDDAILQRYALATFYFSTYVYAEIVDSQNGGSGGGWTYGDYWMSEKGICMWFGVSCPPHLKEGLEEVHYNENSDILRLNLTDNNIRGIVPSELAALENLVSMDLGNNKLEGTVPKAFTELKQLRKYFIPPSVSA